MKFGILTLHEANSYGAVLQSYALQTALERLGAQAEFVAFTHEKAAAAPQKSAPPSPLIARIRQAGEQRNAHFDAFRGQWLHCAEPILWKDKASAAEKYDRFIAGSDQVWNPRIPEVDERYFLTFAPPAKRYSYAASFGSGDLPENFRGWCAGQLSDFQGLSVREESGKKLLADLTGRDATVCLDPTLLLDREEWSKLTGEIDGERYALLFMLKYDPQLYERAQGEAQKQGLELRVVSAEFIPKLGFDAWSGVGVEKWLSLIKGAECVFTNSFHGAVFTLIFERPLAVSRLTGELSSRNGRIEELLKNMGMEAAFESLAPALPREAFEAKLAEKRTLSLNYLKEIATDATV